MTDSNLSAVLYKKFNLRLEEKPIPEPGDEEVQVSMQRVGICGTDIHLWSTGSAGPLNLEKGPTVIGHESSGVVSKVGKGVKHLKKGDRVAINPIKICYTCEACKTGRYNLCSTITCLSGPNCPGALARYIVHRADFVYKMPDNVSFEEGALCEPLSVAIHACRRSRMQMGDRVLVCGAGTIGLCVMLVAKALGAAAVCMTDINNERLEFAKRHGATNTIKVDPGQEPEEVAKVIGNTLGCAPASTLECSATQFSVELGVLATKAGGVFVIVGLGERNMSIPVVNLVAREIEILGSIGYTNTYPTALDMISRGRINVEPLVTHKFTLEETLQAFDCARSGAGVKTMIDCGRISQ